MTTTRKAASNVAIWVLLALVATLAFAPLSARAADHLDAPGLTSPGGKTRLDINDVYVFQGSDPSKTVVAATVNPAATGDTRFANRQEGAYHLRGASRADLVGRLWSIRQQDRESNEPSRRPEIALNRAFSGADGI